MHNIETVNHFIYETTNSNRLYRERNYLYRLLTETFTIDCLFPLTPFHSHIMLLCFELSIKKMAHCVSFNSLTNSHKSEINLQQHGLENHPTIHTQFFQMEHTNTLTLTLSSAVH